MHHRSQQHFPCLHCHPHSYIRMVQQMIERCILLCMTRDQCVKALAQHACIHPLVTLTVWRGLQRENKDFFETYRRFVYPMQVYPNPKWVCSETAEVYRKKTMEK